MQADPDPLELLATSIVERATGGRVSSVTRILRGVMAFKFQVRTERHGSYVARFYPPGREGVADYEPQVLLRAHEAGLRVPRVVAHAGAGPACDAPYVLYEMLEGAPLDECLTRFSENELEHLASEVHAQLDILASLRIAGFGGLVDGTAGQFASWTQLFQEAFDDFHRLDGASSAPALDEAVKALERLLKLAKPPAESRLAWGDLSPDNIIVGSGHELVGLIDFEGVLGAEPILSLGYFEARYPGSRFCAALKRAFSAGSDDSADRVAIYTVLRALRIWPYLSGPLPTGRRRMPLESFLPGLPAAIERVCSAQSI